MRAERGWRVVLLLIMLTGHAGAAQPLPAAMLEFLADFETADGQWIDPEELELMAAAEPAPLPADEEQENE
jgi:hypothetical protein